MGWQRSVNRPTGVVGEGSTAALQEGDTGFLFLFFIFHFSFIIFKLG
jgi:hypothetical protein